MEIYYRRKKIVLLYLSLEKRFYHWGLRQNTGNLWCIFLQLKLKTARNFDGLWKKQEIVGDLLL